MTADEPGLSDVLERGRALGFLGPGPVAEHLAHARAYAAALGPVAGRVADLGSGGGVPALPLAVAWPGTRWLLVERGQRRAAFLEEAVRSLGLADRVAVHAGSAEALGRDPTARASFDLVVARSFGPPAVVAECAAPLLRVGGRLAVSEPPAPDPARWPTTALAELGLGPAERIEHGDGAVVVVHQEAPAPAGIPRPAGQPAKRPRWS